MIQFLKKVPLTIYFDNTDRLILQMKTTKPEENGYVEYYL